MSPSVDDLYAGFVDVLPGNLRELAARLPFELGLAPEPQLTWTQVFAHRVTIEAPALVAEGFPQVSPSAVRDAVLAHALSVIEAFGYDRVADGQVRSSPELLALLESLRTARDRALDSVYRGAARWGREADQETRNAIREEHILLTQVRAATFAEYRRISQAKQAVGLPASLALAKAAGAGPTQLEALSRALRGVWLGLQFEDDAADWEDDWSRTRGAWAVSLTRRRLELVREQPNDDRPTEPDILRRRVFSTRVLYSMLRASRGQYRSAWRYSRALGLASLTIWSDERKRLIDNILPEEAKYPGYFIRSRRLANWAAEILS